VLVDSVMWDIGIPYPQATDTGIEGSGVEPQFIFTC
jgi:hypothetical protein